MRRIPAVCLLLLCLPIPAVADGLWTENGRLICNANYHQYRPRLLPDGGGGLFLVWGDQRNSSSPANPDTDIYAQRLDSQGHPLWAANGVPVCVLPNHQALLGSLQIITDDAGGLIVVWVDNGADQFTTRDIFAQRLRGSDGAPLWAINGMPVCTAPLNQDGPAIATDGANGVIVVWDDKRNTPTGYSDDIYAQRLQGADGSPLWGSNGKAVQHAVGTQYFSIVTSDGAGGAIASWLDTSVQRLFAQRIDASGTTQWAAHTQLTSVFSSKTSLVTLSDGAGGALIFWSDLRNGNGDIFGQRVAANGQIQWDAAGVGICVAAGNQGVSGGIDVLTDGSGGAFLTWQDYRNAATTVEDIYAQRVSSAGVSQWANDGVVVCNRNFEQRSPYLCADGSGSIYVAWEDLRNESAGDLFLQRLNADGSRWWNDDGIPICTAVNGQDGSILADGNGGVFLAWEDWRGGNSTLVDLYAQHLIRPRPVLSLSTPAQAPLGVPVSVTVTGSYFQDDRGAVDHLLLSRGGAAIPAASLTVVNDTTLLATFDVTDLGTTLGAWSLVAHDSCGQTSTAGATLTLYAPSVTDLSWVNSTVSPLTAGTADNLVGQINTHVSGYDLLQTLRVENIGTAQAGRDISQLKLWYGAGLGAGPGVTFDPGTAQLLGTADGAGGYWDFTTAQTLYDQDALYLTATLAGGALPGETLRFSLPAGAADFAFGGTQAAVALVNAVGQTITAVQALVVDFTPLAPVNVLQGEANVSIGEMLIRNQGGLAVDLTAVTIAITDASGTTLAPDQALGRLALSRSGTVLAARTAPLPDGRLALSAPEPLAPGAELRLLLGADILSGPAAGIFRAGLLDGACLNDGALPVDAVQGKLFPLLTGSVNIREPVPASSVRAYPVPFLPSQGSLTVSFSLSSSGRARVDLYTLDGRLVITLTDGPYGAGLHTLTWGGRNADGQNIRSGIYVLRFTLEDVAGRETLDRKIAVVR